MTDLTLWIMLTDLQPHQQCAAVITRLDGTARAIGRMMTTFEITTGGVVNGVMVDPVTYLIHALHQRFSNLEEEGRLQSMTEMLAFERRPGESINSLIARYETVRQRAAIEGQLVISMEGCALQLCRAIGIRADQLPNYLQPFQGRFPQTENEFSQLCRNLRLVGHINEGTRGNIASALHGPLRQAHPRAYHTDTSDVQQTYMTGTYQDAGSYPSDPFGSWTGSAGWGNTAQQPPGHAYLAAQPDMSQQQGDSDNGTDSDTSSDSGGEIIPDPGVSSMSNDQILL